MKLGAKSGIIGGIKSGIITCIITGIKCGIKSSIITCIITGIKCGIKCNTKRNTRVY
jgi:hypothetical protein